MFLAIQNPSMEPSLLREQQGDSLLETLLNVRNDLIKDFLDERHLRAHFATRFSIQELSDRKVAFIKKALMEKLEEPLNENHFKSLIDELRDTGSDELKEEDHGLFYKELEMIFRNYTF